MIPLVVLIVLDGWGLAPPGPGNAIACAKTPNMDSFWASFPHTRLEASSQAVGLPKGEPGNTETGHLNLGAGHIVYQDLLRINMAIANGSFFKNEAFIAAINHCRKNNSYLHIMGLLGAGGVHSSKEHLFALVRLCKEQNFARVFVHVFTDGRDSPPNAAVGYVEELEALLKSQGTGKIASVMGRYWAMDRDLRWERTAKAYFALTRGEGRLAASARQAVEQAYEAGVSDEFIEPTLISKGGKPLALIAQNDAVIFFNFRIDRPRQLTKAFVWDDFEQTAGEIWGFDPYEVKYAKRHTAPKAASKPFQRGPKIPNLFFVTMTEYGKPLKDRTHVAFPPAKVEFPLGAILAENGFRQLRIAESEKERFVTFYFNGQNEINLPGEEWVIVPSPRVETYDRKPEMAAEEITQNFLSKIGSTRPSLYRFVLINFANPDIVAHTGDFEATKQACSFVDSQLALIVHRVNSLSGVTIITGDHGNAEQMVNPQTAQPDTEHTTNPVPFIVVGKEFLGNAQTLESGILADVAPTILQFLDIAVPSTMTGRSLIGLK